MPGNLSASWHVRVRTERGKCTACTYHSSDELAYYMAQGYSVSIDGVGTFKPTLGIAEGKETDTLDGDEQKRNARSIMVNGVNFRASKI